MRKLARSQVRPTAMRLLQKQGGICPLCQKPIDLTIKGELVLDHCHDTGQIRGALHRSCNSAEGRTANAAGRWGAKSMSYSDIIPWLENLVAYLKQPPQDMIYPTFKTADELRMARNVKERTRRAERKARETVRRSRVNKQD
ncbi:putative DNA endonuclease VII [Pectobacterium phage PPWS2]|uniref:Putative DNA endonuclease VII n=1 Tax=Pectobacterium phage PPWS2 TaxID=2153295 RepID=A0A3G9EJ85_9CAUD|nr:endonuclease VII [Pectobacterium phage PPWS2]BBD74663.1 putative DNA endonuclease VII [Pectobacterium phage PPWS2]